MKAEMNYPAKVMLAGEYGVLMGGSALTFPLHSYYARVKERAHIPEGKEDEASRSEQNLQELSAYIGKLPEDTFHVPPDRNLLAARTAGYWLETNIPVGGGLGSSGAVSAALYDCFFPGARELPLQKQREDLAVIESYFHGKSSGVDALTCFTGQSLYFSMDGSVRKVGFDPAGIPGGYRFFLVDSGERIASAPLVQHFLLEMKASSFASSIRNEYLMITQKLIETLLGEREADPGMLVRVLSDYQYTHFRKMIPPVMLDAWIEGQVTGEYLLKLIGSGGGFLLGITHHSNMEVMESRWKEQLIWIE